MNNVDLAAVLADGMPLGLVGAGIDETDLADDHHVCTVSCSVQRSVIDPKSGDLVVTIAVPPQHKWVAMPLTDVMGRKLLLRVFAQGRTLERLGQSSALAPARTRSSEVRERVLDKRRQRLEAASEPAPAPVKRAARKRTNGSAKG